MVSARKRTYAVKPNSRPRHYKGLPCQTRQVVMVHRVKKRKKVLLDRPQPRDGKGYAHQAAAGNNVAFRFKPDVEKSCCSRKCSAFFSDENAVAVTKARAPLLDTEIERLARRSKLMANWAEHLTLADGEPCCAKMACRIYSCSTSFLYGDKRPKQTRSEANATGNTKSSSVMSWFATKKEVLCVMPDDATFQLNYALKKHVYEAYTQDADNPIYSGIYKKIKPSHFYETWAEHFPDVKIRAHCRFSKCEFCVHHRTIIYDTRSTSVEVMRAKDALAVHIKWVCGRERQLYRFKKDQAILQPAKFLSIAIDGTDPLTNGLPKYCEATKADAKGQRLKVHIDLVLVHGSEPRCFLAWENIAGDPNLTIHILFTTLLEEERRRGRLPPVLYLQLDNCIRENKNTYTIMYLVWLVERGIFNQILLSFLPVGHTHNDVDQHASRIASPIKYNNIRSMGKLMELINDNTSSIRPKITFLNEVGDIKELFNPGKAETFPVTRGSRVRRLKGCCTKTASCETKAYAGELSALHWRIRKDTNGNAYFQNRHTIDSAKWSESYRMWNDGEGHTTMRSGLCPSEVRQCPPKHLAETRQAELRSDMAAVAKRLSQDEAQDFNDVVEDLCGEQQFEVDMPPMDHRFECERHEVVRGNGAAAAASGKAEKEAAEWKAPLPMLMAPRLIYQNQNDVENERASHKKRGNENDISLVVNWFVAYTPNYTRSVEKHKRQAFWLGKIVSLYPKEQKVLIERWNTGVVKVLENGTSAKYKAYTGSKADKITSEALPKDRILLTFQHLHAGKDTNAIIKALDRRRIQEALTLRASDNYYGNFVPLDEIPDADEGEGDDDDDSDDNSENEEDDGDFLNPVNHVNAADGSGTLDLESCKLNGLLGQ